MPNKTSPHILSTAANLLGFCLFVITSLHLSGIGKKLIFDELTSIIAILLALSSLLSFMSIKTEHSIIERKLEAVADYLFAIALVGIILLIVYIFFKFAKTNII